MISRKSRTDRQDGQPVWRRRPGAVRGVRGALILALLVFVLAVGMTGAWAAGLAEAAPKVVASTGWTAAIAEAAGAEVIAVLAPLEMRHPPERDFRPSDIAYAVEADYIVWAGYERFVRQLIQAAEIPEDRLVAVYTVNEPGRLVEETRAAAERWGTRDRQRQWEEEFLAAVGRLKERAAQQGVNRVKVVASDHVKVFMEWLGYDVVATFGFEELTPARLHELQSLNPDLVADVWHNPGGEAVAEATGARYVSLINFPGRDGTRTLLDVFEYNARLLGLLD